MRVCTFLLELSIMLKFKVYFFPLNILYFIYPIIDYFCILVVLSVQNIFENLIFGI